MRTLFTTIFLLSPIILQAWGQTGHRTIGFIAENHLSRKAKKQLDLILKGESLAYVSTWMDFIRSDERFNYTHPWHYCTIPDGKTYEEVGPPEEGDAIEAMNRLINELKTGQFSEHDEAFALKCLVHIYSDVHQPLHVGNGTDRGGNDVKVKWFGRSSNLHRVWDTEMINGERWSAEELAEELQRKYKDQIDGWKTTEIMVCINESYDLRSQVYSYPEDLQLGYKYSYKNWHTVEMRLVQAGIRLAELLNEIYG